MSQTATLASLRPCGAMLLAIVAVGWYVDRCRHGSIPRAAEQAKTDVIVGDPRRPGECSLQRCKDIAVGGIESGVCESPQLSAVRVGPVSADRRGALVVLSRHVTQLPAESVSSTPRPRGGSPQPAEPDDLAVQRDVRSPRVTRLPQVSRTPASEAAGPAAPLRLALRFPLADLALNAPAAPAKTAPEAVVPPPAQHAGPTELPQAVPLQIQWESLLEAPLLDSPTTFDPVDSPEDVPPAQQDRDSQAPRDFSLPGGGLDIRQLAPTRFIAPLPSATQPQ